jgi:PilZ domain
MNDETDRVSATRATQRPRSPRVPVNFTVELQGQTPDGAPFNVRAEAVLVSRGGATLITDVAVAAGTPVQLTAPFGRTLAAEVNGVWTDAEDGRQRIGIRLLDPHGWFAE